MPRLALIIAATMLAAPATAQAAFQDTAMLDRAVQQFTGHSVGQEGGARTSVDDRLKLAQCPTLALAWRSEAHDAVVVSCPDADWRVFVPVIAPPRPVALLAAAAPAPKPEPVIRRGDPVTIEAGAPGFSVTRDGIALGDAPAGGRLLVQVDGVKQPIQTIAVETGRASLPGWNR